MIVEEGPSAPPSPRKNRKDPLIEDTSAETPVQASKEAEPGKYSNVFSYNLLLRFSLVQPTTPISPRIRKIVDISLIDTPIISSRFQRSSQSEDVLKQSLLNLSPQSDDDSDEPSKAQSPVDGASSPKKKRRRRKKKKNAQASAVTDA